MLAAAASVMIGINPYASLALAALVGFLVLSSQRARRLIGWISTALHTLMGAYVGYACESWSLGIILSILVFLVSSALHDTGNQHYDDLQSPSR
ncbi:hypothetical protein P3W85_19580 [Cupriavidus basilensis]|uniref:Uncharacterized protein n=1 Tax=Cupriavidus basilensis TaxID=68895 RepID=A0ABT6AR90_9BURK|nr:hypothetical protein [Cupriavidus basilensis]MDF3835145.1 hypothetical protein [Cupriavidus basilensis]